jgi:DNA-directed RNA polymerase subunit RPC12/RpoP
MGLTCSVLGHAFEAAELEREREEQGSEAVTIVREVETCRRCGERRVVSENKEVTAIVDPSDVGVDAAAPEPEPEPAAAAPSPPDEEETPAGTEAGGEPGPGADAGPDAAPDPTPDEATLDDTAPEQDLHSAPEPEDDFEPPTDPEEDDAEILEDSREEPRTPGQWPDDDGDFEPSSLTGGAADAGAGENVVDDASADDEPDVEPAATASSVARGDYVCPSCGFSTPAESSSLRAGDACPECQHGYLESR